MTIFNEIHFIPVLVATVASFAIGFLWYGPLFGKTWQRHVGLSDAEIKNANMGVIFGSAFILTLVMAILIDSLVPAENTDWLEGLSLGLVLGVGLVAASFGVNYLFSRRSLPLFFIDAGYHVVILGMIGAVIAAWR